MAEVASVMVRARCRSSCFAAFGLSARAVVPQRRSATVMRGLRTMGDLLIRLRVYLQVGDLEPVRTLGGARDDLLHEVHGEPVGGHRTVLSAELRLASRHDRPNVKEFW